MKLNSLKNQFDLKELELNALLEITQAINNNLPEVSLYKIYGFTLRANLQIKKLALYVKDEDWVCKVNYGTSMDFISITLDDSFLDFRDIQFITDADTSLGFKEFDMVVPVMHKDSVLAFVFVGGLVDPEQDEQTIPDTSFIQTISNIILVAIENKRLARQQLEQEALRKELEIARGVQQLLFPKNLPQDEDLKATALYLPHQDVGGDYYDYIEIDDNQFLLCIADVSGKGVPAAILMSNFQAALRTMIRHTTDLKEIIEELNHQTVRTARGENFITFFVAIIDRLKKEIYYVNAGHNPPLLICDTQPLQLLELGTTILGAFKPLPFLRVGKVHWNGYFTFFSYTDGLTETFSETDEPFELDRVKEILYSHHQESLEKINGVLLKRLNEFRGKNTYTDDITILSCKVGVAP
ncbi:MAG: PP2C family protein-serine/threonine phosphatase [Cyclobacteriaceae bacterium]|nr:PP2C family protein-serine/threonine phosphatase [Cyclobacteriaceae bacterium]